jgi:hypothetical protein
MDSKHSFIERILPYRLEAIEVLELALQYRLSWEGPVPMQIFFEGRLSIEGLSTAFTNAAIESGVIHCRALLEFIGLRADAGAHGRLAQRGSGRADDLLIEHFSSDSGPLKLVTPAEAVAPYDGPAHEAEQALAHVIHVANKGLNHSTIGLISEPDDLAMTEVASRGVRALLVNHFYVPMGIAPPEKRISSRRRDEP